MSNPFEIPVVDEQDSTPGGAANDYDRYTYDPELDSQDIQGALADMRSAQDTDTKARILLHILADLAPRNDWGKIIDAIPTEQGERGRVTSRLSNYAAYASCLNAEIMYYADMRAGAGCGDHDHDQSMDYAQRATRKVRKTLGYTTP